MGKLIRHRLLLFVPQLLGVSFLVFLMIRMMPGDPAVRLAGLAPTPERIAQIRARLDLDQPLLSQFWAYLQSVAHLDFGSSTVTGNTIAADLAERLPGTIVLIGTALVLMMLLAVGLGLYTALNPRGLVARIVQVYGMLAGALPDFWLGLLLVFFFYTLAGIAPAPMGQIDLSLAPPPDLTGFYVIDALISGHVAVFFSAVGHLILPVTTLVFVYSAAILKQTRAAMDQVLETDWMRFAIVSGVSQRTVLKYGLRNVLPQVLSVAGVMMLVLIGSTVIVEQIFSWGGIGQYAIQAIQTSDYQAIQAFVLITALFSLTINLVIDLAYAALDPRIKYAR
ncbi:ABC transporter permease subunit [Pseudooceanicola sp. GBMRC 2024]|uniref:ABC transporter permease subunit n=1 Tax=Pseudooceanicola albus TaxID=2692189 RepID=A0A6L7G2S6_9RHOB|nr:ABC transporter permease [Pseudooceanicola albus]MXN17736.1 ABC transporter permease subunit [Pseudooceanicola albus]